jgi:hypothetical protein
MTRLHESHIWTAASLGFSVVAVYVAVFTDASFTVYGVGAVAFGAMARIATLQQRLDAQARYWDELTAALRGHLARNATRD